MPGKVVRPPFVPINGCTQFRRELSQIKHFVFHDTEGGGTCESIGNYLNSKGYGIMYVSEPSGRVGSLGDWTKGVYHVALHNTECVGLEQIGYASTSSRGWFLKLRQLWAAAWIAAYVSQELGIPLVQSARNRAWIAPSGFCQHSEVPDNDHTDCGPGYPFGWVLNTASKWKESGVPVWVRLAIPKK
jgi:hypothetical protein